MANLDIIERENLLAEGSRLEATLHRRLARLAEHPYVEEVRSGTGAVAAVQLGDPGQAAALAKRLRSHGVATRAVGAGGIQVSPALVMTDDEVGVLADAIEAALEASAS
jgi:adenosylmethionine-8-amino-7-oxononanoate aminotransferase